MFFIHSEDITQDLSDFFFSFFVVSAPLFAGGSHLFTEPCVCVGETKE